MSADVELVVAADATALATDVAARVLVTLAHAQQTHGRAILVLTAGSIMEKVWSAIATSADAATVNWADVDVCFGDERFVPSGTQDRNDRPALEILFSTAPFNAARVLSMPASDGIYGGDLDAAAAGYTVELSLLRRVDDIGDIPNFDLVLLGVGPDGHCASLFPQHPALGDTSGPVIAVRDSPKPPPQRLSLSFSGLAAATEIWVVAAGAEKAAAVASVLSGADPFDIPSAGVRGRERTIWFTDAAAAAELVASSD